MPVTPLDILKHQIKANLESRMANACEAVGNRYARQINALIEGPVPNAGDWSSFVRRGNRQCS